MNEIDISCPSSWSCLCSRQMKSMLWCFPASAVVLWRASVWPSQGSVQSPFAAL